MYVLFLFQRDLAKHIIQNLIEIEKGKLTNQWTIPFGLTRIREGNIVINNDIFIRYTITMMRVIVQAFCGILFTG